MKALHQLIAPNASSLKESELLLEINNRGNADYCRGVKRQCLSVQKISGEDDDATPSVRGRSFLETKWESENSRKRRKLPATTNSMDDHMISDDLQDEKDEDMAEIGESPGGTTSNGDSAVQEPEETGESPTHTPGLCAAGAAYSDMLHGEPGCLTNKERGVSANINAPDTIAEDEVRDLTPTVAADGAAATENALDVGAAADEEELQSDVATDTSDGKSEDTMAIPAGMSAAQESTLVRSALRSSLDGDDTALLNNFLSKAKAKRDAKAAAEAEAAATTIASDPEEKEPEQPPQGQQVFVEIPTPERRVLEDLDANTSSPQKSPSKPDDKNESVGDNDSASPVARRSTRVRSLQRAVAPSFRTTLSLRRARGNEFVFLQRTEAQEMALTTRRNTKQNKGDALMPKFKLQELARQTPESNSNTFNDGPRKSNKPKKYVTWNEERLVEYEGDELGSDDELAGSQDLKATTASKSKPAEKKRGAASSSRSSLSQGSLKIGAGAKPAATAAARGRRVRRLGPPKPLESTVVTDSNDSASSPPSPSTAAGSTPIAQRKKLTPKSPKTSLSRTASKVPAAAAAASNSELPSLLSGGRSVKTNLLKVNAGSTPMPRRVRRA
ncbi:hypothetical protein BDW72DRAFT_170101 [Aspergillus terricola var. indicus]